MAANTPARRPPGKPDAGAPRKDFAMLLRSGHSYTLRTFLVAAVVRFNPSRAGNTQSRPAPRPLPRAARRAIWAFLRDAAR